jgi:hypothetical protein
MSVESVSESGISEPSKFAEAPSRGTWTRWKTSAIIQEYRIHSVASSTVHPRQNVLQQTWADRAPRVTRPLVKLAYSPPRRRFIALARWEGAVTECLATYFAADVIDLQSDSTASVEFDYHELSVPSDRALCRPGNLFYWAVGYEIANSGERRRASVIIFRRRGTDQQSLLSDTLSSVPKP